MADPKAREPSFLFLLMRLASREYEVEALLEVLEVGLIGARAALRQEQAADAEVILDAIHNLPTVLGGGDLQRWLDVDLALVIDEHDDIQAVREIAGLARRVRCAGGADPCEACLGGESCPAGCDDDGGDDYSDDLGDGPF